MRLVLIMVVALCISACDTTPSVNYRLVNASKPLSEYDSDLYKCTMMARQMYPPPSVQNDAITCSETGALPQFRTTRCVNNVVSEAPWVTSIRVGKVNSQARNCMARQGWRSEEIPSQTYQRQDNATRLGTGGDVNEGGKCNSTQQCSGVLICANAACVDSRNIFKNR